MKKLVALLLAAMMLLASVAALAESPEGYPEIVEGIDFGGATVTIYDYWTGDDSRKAEPTDEEQALYDYRDWLMETYNVVIRQIQGGDWGSCAEEMINFNSAPDGSLRAYIIEPGKVGSLIGNGVAAPIEYDLSAKKWNQVNISTWTIDGTVYGVSTGEFEPRTCLYFNKRILTEANIDWNTIYDMQAAGTWTWAAFEDMLKATTRDLDNDSIIDVYGVLGSADDMYQIAVANNGGEFFTLDENGKISATMNSDATLTALNWAQSIYQNYWMPTPDGASWDWYKEAWKSGSSAFYVYQCYGGFNDGSEMEGMEDEWGCVAFPVPNEGDKYLTTISENTTLIPSCYDAETVAKIMFIVDMWTNETPGYTTEDDEEAWVGNKTNYTDDRAVYETYAMLRQADSCWFNNALLLGTCNDVLGNTLFWNLGSSTPAELIEAAMPTWQGYCDTYNAK